MIGQAVLRALGAFWVIYGGYGIVVLAAFDLFSSLLANSILLRCCFREYRQLSIVLGRFDRAVLKRIWQFSLYASIILTTAQVIYFTDTLVVGAFLSVSAVTFYAIGGGLNLIGSRVSGGLNFRKLI